MLIRILLIIAVLFIGMNGNAEAKRLKCCKKKNAATCAQQSVKAQIDLLVLAEEELRNKQLNSLLGDYFITETDGAGKEQLKPIMKEILIERTVLVMEPGDQSAGPPRKVVTMKVDVPLITLASISYLGVNRSSLELPLDAKGNLSKHDMNPVIELEQLPLPKGLNTIIEALTNTIQPVEQ